VTEQEFSDRLKRMETEGVNLTDAMGECRDILLAGVEQLFDRRSDASGQPWPARKNPRPRHPLLELTGSLRRAVAGPNADGLDDPDITEDGLTLRVRQGPSGTSRAGIRRHEFGDAVAMGRPGILPRPYFGVSDDTADDVADVIADAVAEAIL
jgi:phage gpG-like protein